ncbi:MAG: TatD family hydrolase [Proteobacteria bacterium]|nr:TatD family hydrolase [Pseudomonadota bacterium]MCL2306962.1 TatD family hydrolase [Pseudomonadota bacterium]
MFVDSHCHLDFPELASRLDEVQAAMHAANVTHALCAGVELTTFPAMLALVEPYSNVYCSVGLHPGVDESAATDVEELLRGLLRYAALPKVLAIGETGLDYYHVSREAEWQRARFRAHIAAAHAVGKPLIVHMRDATEDTLRILREEGADRVGGVMHCFTGDWAAAEAALALGFYISFSGVVTFKGAKVIKEAARRVPLDRLLIETDSPYLAPMPHRGHYPNHPAWVVHVAEEIARLRDMPLDEVGRATSANFFRLFRGCAE